MADRASYVLTGERLTREQAERASAAVLEVVRPDLRSVRIDAYSDAGDELPPAVAAAQQSLRQRGRRYRGHPDPSMGITLSPDDDQLWADVVTYAAWSTNAEFWGEPEDDLFVGVADSGITMIGDLTADQADEMRNRLAGLSSVVGLTEVRGERSESRQERPQRKWHRLFGR